MEAWVGVVSVMATSPVAYPGSTPMETSTCHVTMAAVVLTAWEESVSEVKEGSALSLFAHKLSI